MNVVRCCSTSTEPSLSSFFSDDAYCYPPRSQLSSSNASGQLPVTRPSAEELTLAQRTEFMVKEHQRSRGEIFSMNSMNKNEPLFFKVMSRKVVQVSLIAVGATYHHKDPRELCDANNCVLYRWKPGNGLTTELVNGETGETVITTKRKGWFFGNKSTAYAWRGHDEGKHQMEVKGYFWCVDYNFKVKEVATGRIVVALRRKGFNGRSALHDWSSFVLRVEAGENSALMALFGLVLVELFRGEQ